MPKIVRHAVMLVLSALAGLLLAACSGAASSTPTAQAAQSPTGTPTPEPEATVNAAPTVTAAPTADVSADLAALRPDAPAAEDADFRADPVAVVAATGRPQLIEVFSYD